ncbi:MAG: hypothetical protein ACE5LV_07905, partial [Candidatus Aminicenantales bacterium]
MKLSPADSPQTHDVLVLNGKAVDGTGNLGFRGNVAVHNHRIVRVLPAGRLRRAAARERLDAAGLVDSPGTRVTRRYGQNPW